MSPTTDNSHCDAIETSLGRGLTQKQTAANLCLCPRTIGRAVQRFRVTGSYHALRKRTPTLGFIAEYHQRALFIINAAYPQLYYDELANVLRLMCGWQYDPRLIRNLFQRHRYRGRLLNEFRPIESDAALFRFWREHVIYVNGPIRALQLVYLDEASTKRRDMWRLRGRGVIGERLMVRNLFANSKLADCTILAISIAGIQAAYAVDIEANGNLSK